MDFLPISNSEDFLKFARQYSSLVDGALTQIEADIKNNITPSELAHSLPKIISMVNVAGYLRGQDGAFSDMMEFRRGSIDMLYKNEDVFEERLHNIITYVTSDDDGAKYYRAILMQYYLQNRGVTFGPKTFID